MSNRCYLANTLANTNNIPKVYPCYLASIMTNTNNIPKVDFCYLASSLTNINNKVNNFLRKKVNYV